MVVVSHPRVVHWKKEPYDVFVGRPSPFGNPFSHKFWSQAEFKVNTAAESLIRYKEWVFQQAELLVKIKTELKGKTLGCWCSVSENCHGYILLHIANDWPLPEFRIPENLLLLF